METVDTLFFYLKVVYYSSISSGKETKKVLSPRRKSGTKMYQVVFVVLEIIATYIDVNVLL